MRNLYFIKVKEDYIKYLRKFDNKVQDNSELKSNKPYIGVLIQNSDGQKYFAPLSSPKEKHIIFNKLEKENKLPIDIFLIRDNLKNLILVINYFNIFKKRVDKWHGVTYNIWHRVILSWF